MKIPRVPKTEIPYCPGKQGNNCDGRIHIFGIIFFSHLLKMYS